MLILNLMFNCLQILRHRKSIELQIDNAKSNSLFNPYLMLHITMDDISTLKNVGPIRSRYEYK